jgi:hypothetical protein
MMNSDFQRHPIANSSATLTPILEAIVESIDGAMILTTTGELGTSNKRMIQQAW